MRRRRPAAAPHCRAWRRTRRSAPALRACAPAPASRAPAPRSPRAAARAVTSSASSSCAQSGKACSATAFSDEASGAWAMISRPGMAADYRQLAATRPAHRSTRAQRRQLHARRRSFRTAASGHGLAAAPTVAWYTLEPRRTRRRRVRRTARRRARRPCASAARAAAFGVGPGAARTARRVAAPPGCACAPHAARPAPARRGGSASRHRDGRGEVAPAVQACICIAQPSPGKRDRRFWRSGCRGTARPAVVPSGRTSRQSRVGEQATSSGRTQRRRRAGARQRIEIIAAIIRAPRGAAQSADDDDARSHAAAPPLAGVRVLDLSRVLAGPWCTQMLADLGADVIKVERPGGGDDTRGWGPPFLKDRDGARHAPKPPTTSAPTATSARSRSTSPRPRARRWCATLAAQCDVLVENFKVGDLARYGLDYAALRALNPRLVYCSITGFGQTGPYRERAGYDYVIQGMGGLMSVTGERRRRDARRRAAEGRRRGRRPVHRHVRQRRDPGRAAPPRRAPAQGQHIDMALLDTPGGDARQPRRRTTSSPATRRGAPATRTRTSCPTRCSRPPTATSILAVGNDGQFAQVLRRGRLPGAGAPTRASPPTPTACATAQTLVPLLAALLKQRGRAGMAGGAGGGRGAVRRRSTTWPRCSPTRRCSARGMTVELRASAGRRGAAGRQPDEAVGDAGPLPPRAAAARRPHRAGAGRVRPRCRAIAALRRAGAI